MIIHVLDSQGSPVAGATVALRLGTRTLGLAISDKDGSAALATGAGRYRLEILLPGRSADVQEVTIDPGAREIDVVLRPVANESVEVQANEADLSPDTTSPVTVLPVQAVKEVPSRPKTALEALPLVPGVVRTYDGQLQIAGQGEAHSVLLVDGVDENDPATGRFSLSPPIDAVQTVHVSTPSYLAQDGRFSAGAIALETEGGGSHWHFDVNDPFPEFRIRSGHVRGVRSMSPRIATGGPLLGGRLQFLESYGFTENNIPVRTLFFPNNEIKLLSSNSFTRLDATLPSNQSLALSVQLSPQSIRYAGLDYFHPQSVTTNDEANSAIGTAIHRWVHGQGFVQSTLSIAQFSSSSLPQRVAEMVVRPSGTSGAFYKSSTESAGRVEWNEAWTFQSSRHQISLGSSFAAVHAGGVVTERPVLIQGSDGTLLQRIDFSGGRPFSLNDVQPDIYGQDHWTIRDGVSLDYGVRVEAQSITDTARVAPRVAVAWSGGKGSHSTTVRAGIGAFYDNVPLNTFSFSSLSSQTITTFAASGAFTQQYANVVGESVCAERDEHGQPHTGDFSPMTLNESFEIEHAFGARLSGRARLLHSESNTQLTLTPSLSSASFVLTDGGKLNYTQLELTAKLELQKGLPLYASYVRSSATGTLNSPSEVLSMTGDPFVRGTANGRQPSDLPNRFLLWGSARLPWQVTLTPQLELRSGFVYPSLDVYQNFVSFRSGMRRYPFYGSLDLRASKLVKLNAKYSLRPALSVTNATNHFNGLEIHNNVADPQFGTPFGNNDRHERFDLDVVF